MNRRGSHIDRLTRGGGGRRKALGKAVYAAADMLAAEAAVSITHGAVSGKNHVPSKPGEPPNADTQQLNRSIHVEKVDDLTARVVADAPHAVALEFGTSKMAERPFMRPAAARVRRQMRGLISMALRKPGKI